MEKLSKQPPSRAKVILHPVRARIIVELSDCPLTPLEIASRMEDIPLGTVYRHINILLEAGMIEITRERRVNGTLERQFALVESQAFLTEEDRERLTGDDILGLVTALIGVVQGGFSRYVQHATLPPQPGEISFVAKSLYLTQEEYQAFRNELTVLLQKVGRTPSPEYRRRLIGFFMVPDVLPPPAPDEENSAS